MNLKFLAKILKFWKKQPKVLWSIQLEPLSKSFSGASSSKDWVLDPNLSYFVIPPLELEYLPQEELVKKLEASVRTKPSVGIIQKCSDIEGIMSVLYNDVSYPIQYSYPGLTVPGLKSVSELYRIKVILK